MLQTATVRAPIHGNAQNDLSQDLLFSFRQHNLLLVVGALLLLTSPAWLWLLFFAGDYEFASSLVLVPPVCVLSFIVIIRITNGKPSLRRLMLLSYAMKLASAGGYMALLYLYYGKGADATVYYNVGKQWAGFFTAHGTYPVTGHVWGTYFINLVAAVLVTIFGTAFPMFNVLFATAAFWGIYFFYRAFGDVWPTGNKEFAALVLFLLPSCQFWDAALGKDALMMLSLGMASFGYAELLSGRLVKGFTYLFPAMLIGAFTRPHVAGMAAISMLLPYMFSKGRKGILAGFTRFLGIPIMAAGVAYLVRNATELLRVDSPESGLRRIETLGAGTMHGGSSFGVGQSSAAKVLLSPFLMFRPFPWEIPNLLGLAATLEGLLLLYFLWRVRSNLLKALLRWREHPFFTYAASFGAIFSVVFSLALSNFGLLIRQRTQFTPLLVLVIAGMRARSSADTAEAHVR